MNNTDLYKQFYFKELSSRSELNNAVSLPITILTGIISAHVYVYSKAPTGNYLMLIEFFTVGAFIAFCFAGVYIARSYSGLLKSHWYAEIEGMEKFYDFQKKCEIKEQPETFNAHLEKQLAITSNINFEINRKRSGDIAKCKVTIFISMIFTFLSAIVFVLWLIKNTQPINQ